MREYKIYKTNLWYWVYRKKNVGKISLVQFLHANKTWGTNKSTATTFYTKDLALNALVVMKVRWDTPVEEQPVIHKDKKNTWSEL